MMIADSMYEIGYAAKQAARTMAGAKMATKSEALRQIARTLDERRADLLAANAEDMKAAEAQQLEAPLMSRLHIDERAIERMIANLNEVAALPDPVGQISQLNPRPSGIQVGKMRVPLGVIGIIYESRPSVTIEAASLCLKSGNAVILRGGSEAIRSNLVLAECIESGLTAIGLPPKACQLIKTTDREAVGLMIKMSDFIDVLIPRGGRSLIERIANEACIPVIKHLDGVCHLYIDADADVEQALAIAFNAKAEKLAVCCAIETLLVAKSIAPKVLPQLLAQYKDAAIEVRGCEATCALDETLQPASEADWAMEYLGPILSVRLVDDVDAAMAHIARYGSAHTDAIVTDRQDVAWRFLREVDSASVLVNASTQFADGMEYGLGAEVGISTDKLHVRGPVGLMGLTSEKFIVIGQGEIRNRQKS